MKNIKLRDFFAAMALAGDCAAGEDGWDVDVEDYQITQRARLMYRLADAMLSARTKE